MVVISHFKLNLALFLQKWLICIPNISAVPGNVVFETIHDFYRTAIFWDECRYGKAQASRYQARMGSGFVHLDTTYWGRSFGVLLALDSRTGKPLYMAFVKSETTKDYENAVASIKARGYDIKGLVIDGKKSLFMSFAGYHIQMCQFHMKQIIRRYLTLNPRMLAGRELKELVGRLHRTRESDFRNDYQAWKEAWKETIERRSVYMDGSTHYTHQRLRAAMHSLDFYMPYLFTCQREDCKGMPNTNNKIEGTFTDLKKNLNNHSGLTMENRKRFISGFFLALM